MRSSDSPASAVAQRLRVGDLKESFGNPASAHEHLVTTLLPLITSVWLHVQAQPD
jgi:hypothetical protein